MVGERGVGYVFCLVFFLFVCFFGGVGFCFGDEGGCFFGISLVR